MQAIKTCKLLAAAAVAAAFATAAQAQVYPDKPVKMIVPFAAGGSTDVVARIVAKELSDTLKQPFVVENKGGAGGAIGTDAVAKAAPDGYTLGATGTGSLTIIPYIDPKLSYNPEKDLAIVAILSKLDIVVVVRSESKIKSMKELLDEARAKGELSYSTAGAGTPAHLDMENLWSLTKVKMLHVPFPGDAPAVTNVLGGTVDFGFNAASSIVELVKAGKLRALAVGGPQRFAALPDVPTIAEALDLKGYTAEAWNALVAPAGTPPDVIATLNRAVNDAVRKPDVKEKLEAVGLSQVLGDARVATDYVRKDAELRKRVLGVIGLRRD